MQNTSLTKRSLVLATVFASFMATMPVEAQDSARTISATSNATAAPSAASLKQEAQQKDLQGRADKEIARRITALNEAEGKVQGLKHLSAEQKSTLTTGISTQINSLKALQVKIDADTDAAILKADVQSVVNAYRIFVVYIPQVHLLEEAESISSVADKETAFATKVQPLIAKATSAGKDTTQATTDLADLQSKVQQAETMDQQVVSAIMAISPSGYPANKSTLTSAQASLKTATADLKAGRQDGTKLVADLKAISAVTN